MNRPYTTLFMLSSIDGKISTGSVDSRDFDSDLPKIKGASEGLRQYYEIEQKTDFFSFNTGRVFAKVGWNKPKKKIGKSPVRFVVVDNNPHLTLRGMDNLLEKCTKLFLVTTNPKHPAFKIKNENLEVIFFPKKVDFHTLFKKLKKKYGVKRLTIQSGGSMNANLLRLGLIDRLSIVYAPIVIGGDRTSSLADGESITKESELNWIKTFELKKVHKLKNSYLHLIYERKK